MASNRLAKTQRQHRVVKLLSDHHVTSQTQLVELLAADGVVATQATVSRDLEELGAVKVRVPGGEMVYAVPELSRDRLAPEDHLRRVLADWVVQVAHSGTLVVVQTPRGAPTSSARPSTAAASPASSARSPATTRSWWSPTSARAQPRSP